MRRHLLTSLLLACVALGGAVAVLPATPVSAAPEPSVTPISWELNFKHGSLERIYVTIDGKRKAFWFMRYSVVNNSGRDVLFTPSFEIVGDAGSALEAFKDVPNDVFKKIKELYKNDFLQSPTAIYGKLLQGEDNAKDGVIIFSDLDAESRNFKLFIAGLSGETAEVKNPMTGKPVILQKTLELDYNIPGESISADPNSQLRVTKWVMK
jgi:hypothetical protein